MSSENTVPPVWQHPETTSENTEPDQRRRPGATSITLSDAHRQVLAGYLAVLARAPLSAETVRTYTSKVRQYLAWLAIAEPDGDPLAQAQARDWAVRDYRSHLLGNLKRKPATINNALAAIDDFYTRLGLGPANAARLDLPDQAPKSLDKRATLRWLRAVQAHPSTRDRVLAQLPFYAGIRIIETVRLDLDDIQLSARKGTLRVLGKGDKIREIPIHPQLRTDLHLWLHERPDWPEATRNPALLLNNRGGRLTTRGASGIFRQIADNAGLDDQTTAHILRHTFATTLIRGGTDLVIVAELLGHSRLDTVRVYTRPTAQDQAKALELLPTDR
jgi:site-specific recombinase XerD